jgi:hypothetical protein
VFSFVNFYLVGMFIGWSSKKFIYIFLLIRNTQKKQEAQRFKTGCCLFCLSSLKPLHQLEPNLVGLLIGWSSKSGFVCLFLLTPFIHNKTRGPKLTKVYCLFLIFFSETTGPIVTKLGRNVHWMIL